MEDDCLIMIEMDPEDADRCVKVIDDLMSELFGEG